MYRKGPRTFTQPPPMLASCTRIVQYQYQETGVGKVHRAGSDFPHHQLYITFIIFCSSTFSSYPCLTYLLSLQIVLF